MVIESSIFLDFASDIYKSDASESATVSDLLRTGQFRTYSLMTRQIDVYDM